MLEIIGISRPQRLEIALSSAVCAFGIDLDHRVLAPPNDRAQVQPGKHTARHPNTVTATLSAAPRHAPA